MLLYKQSNYMKTYVVNLEREESRREYVKGLVAKMPFLEVEFIKAVEGKKLSHEEKRKAFDNQQAYQKYGRICRDGEIGCTLSHRNCYKQIIERNEDYALILEDDIVISRDLSKIMDSVPPLMLVDKPRVLLLSGFYWFISKKRIQEDYYLASIYDAYFTHAYVINQAAAKLILQQRAAYLADDWKYMKEQGVEILAFLPHLVDQLPEEVAPSSIFGKNENRCMNKRNMRLMRRLKMYQVGGIKKWLMCINRFERP